MKIIILILLIAIAGCTGTSNKQASITNVADSTSAFTHSDSISVVTLVKDFFQAFDERDVQKLSDILGPSIKIIHHNGATTTREEMLSIIKETKNWWPRTRKLTGFECIANGGMAVVGCNNEVIFSSTDNKKIVERYRESWVFTKDESQWKPVRCHYSKVTVDKHTEEVE